MVLKFDGISALKSVWGMVVLGASLVSSTAIAQTNNATETPFIGFRPFDGSSASASASNAAAASNSQSQAARPTRIVPEQPASAYPYPAGGQPGYGVAASNQNATAERASLGGRLPSTSTPTGALNVSSGTTGFGGQNTGVNANVDPALWKRYQQEIQQQQAQQQYQQYQQWLAQQQQFLQQRQTSTVGYQVPQRATAQPTPAVRPDTQISVARPATPKLNQAVVQQVSSTTTSTRDRSVARADYSSVASNNTSVAKQTTSASNTLAKPQCCCVPQNCCVAAPQVQTPVTPAPVFRPQTVNANPAFNQAANQVPTLQLPNLSPNVASTYGGFLGQNGAAYQVQPQTGFQFQPGLGVPQFNSTGALGRGNWFSNAITGTGAYTPLLPIVSAQGARLGQGIIGQPTAYIDGQPIRNLLRYVFP